MSRLLEAHLNAMMGWFSTESELRQWAGPFFRYPFDTCSFRADLQLDRLASRSLLGPQDALLAFGQYYRRLNRCHLGRLVVSPARRRQGYGRIVI